MVKHPLGKTGLLVSPLGMGTLTMGFSQMNLSVESGAAVILRALKKGINFLDTAEYYDTYRYLRPALDQARRDPDLAAPVICSKSLAKDYAGMTRAVEDCLSALDLDQADLFLLHEVRGMPDFQTRAGAWQALRDLKASGKIKAIGISTHHVDAARAMAEESACDAVFALCNRAGLGIRTCDGTVQDPHSPFLQDRPARREEMESAIRLLAAQGIGVFTMKAFGGGNLITDYRACLDYACSIPGNCSVMVGLGTADEVDTAADYLSGRLDPAYVPDTSGKRMKVDQSDCEGCGTCVARCTSHAINWNDHGLAEIDPSKCVHCGYCAPVCPVRAIIFQ